MSKVGKIKGSLKAGDPAWDLGVLLGSSRCLHMAKLWRYGLHKCVRSIRRSLSINYTASSVQSMSTSLVYK